MNSRLKVTIKKIKNPHRTAYRARHQAHLPLHPQQLNPQFTSFPLSTRKSNAIFPNKGITQSTFSISIKDKPSTRHKLLFLVRKQQLTVKAWTSQTISASISNLTTTIVFWSQLLRKISLKISPFGYFYSVYPFFWPSLPYLSTGDKINSQSSILWWNKSESFISLTPKRLSLKNLHLKRLLKENGNNWENR